SLLVEEAVTPDLVADQPRGRAEHAMLLRIVLRAGVARHDDEARGQVLIDLELSLTAQIAVGSRDHISKRPERLADACARVVEATANHVRERMETEGQPGRHPEVAAAAAQAPEQLGRLLPVDADD